MPSPREALVRGALALGAVCLMTMQYQDVTSATLLLLKPEQAPGSGPARLTSLARTEVKGASASRAMGVRKLQVQVDPYTAKPAEANYVDNAAAGLSFGGRREARDVAKRARKVLRLRTQKLVEQATSGILGKQFDDVYAQKHWFENADANDDATPELDIPQLKSRLDAIPTTPKADLIQDAAARVLDREAGLMNPVVGDMKTNIRMASEGGVEKADGENADRAAHAAHVEAKPSHKALSDNDLKLLQDARQRQAAEAGVPMADAFPSMQQMGDMKTPNMGGGTPVLAGLKPAEEPKAIDNPIGVASAAKILKDAEMFDQSTNGDAMDKWKDAAKGAGPAILNAIKDDVSTFSPFPKTSLSERMEVEDVWNRARANTKSAGKLDGDAAQTKDTVENAEAQAEGQAYLAANEAAAVDAYDVSFPNPDMMAKGGAKKMSAQALANKGDAHTVAMQGQALASQPHKSHLLAGQASAVGGVARATQALASRGRGHKLSGRAQARGVHKMLQSRVQALAEVVHYEGEGVGTEQNTAVQVALKDERAAKRTVQALQIKVAVAKGEAKEAAKLRGFTSMSASAARATVTKYQLAILREGGAAQEARTLASQLAGSSPMHTSTNEKRNGPGEWQEQQRKAELAASADRSKRALVMRLEDRAARLQKQLDMTHMPEPKQLHITQTLQANSVRRGGLREGTLRGNVARSKSSVRRMVDSDGGSIGASWGTSSAFADSNVPRAHNLLQQQLQAEEKGGDDADALDSVRFCRNASSWRRSILVHADFLKLHLCRTSSRSHEHAHSPHKTRIHVH